MSIERDFQSVFVSETGALGEKIVIGNSLFSNRSRRRHSKVIAIAERVAAITSEKGKAHRIPSTPHKAPKPIIAGIRAANGDAIPAQAVDRAAKVRSANLKSGLQFTAGDDSQLTAVILLQVFGDRVVRRHEDSFPGQLPGKSAKKQGPSVPFG